MNSVQNEALDRALRLLSALRAEYKIILPDGREYGGLEIAKKYDRVKAERKSLGHIYLPYLQDMSPGDITEIPFEDKDLSKAQSNIGAYLCNTWGKGSFLTKLNREKKIIEVLRV